MLSSVWGVVREGKVEPLEEASTRGIPDRLRSGVPASRQLEPDHGEEASQEHDRDTLIQGVFYAPDCRGRDTEGTGNLTETQAAIDPSRPSFTAKRANQLSAKVCTTVGRAFSGRHFGA